MLLVTRVPVESLLPRLRAIIPHPQIGVRLIVGIVDSIHLGHPQHLDVEITGKYPRHFAPVVIGAVVGLINWQLPVGVPPRSFGKFV